MSVRVVEWKKVGGCEVDIRLRLPNGERHRERRVLLKVSKSSAKRWGQDRERHLLQHGPGEPTKEVPTLEEFAPRFLDGHAKANRQKPSGIAAKRTVLNVHLLPLLGSKKLDAITTEQVQQLKNRLASKAPKTVNNVLTVLNTLLKKAVEWDVIDRMPCVIRLLPIPKGAASFYDEDQFEKLVTVAEADVNATLILLLGGEAGLRCGEMMALQWEDIDQQAQRLCVARSEWKGHVTIPKGGRSRYVPMTQRLAASLRRGRHLRGPRVLCDESGEPLTQKMVQTTMRRIARRAGVKPGVHILRHTFCSHLAMEGAAPRTIQELAGHEDLSTTQRYMHLTRSAVDSAIGLLDRRNRRRGEGGETSQVELAKSLA